MDTSLSRVINQARGSVTLPQQEIELCTKINMWVIKKKCFIKYKDQGFYSEFCSFGQGSVGLVPAAFSALAWAVFSLLGYGEIFFLLSQSGVSRLALLAPKMFVLRFRAVLYSLIRWSASLELCCDWVRGLFCRNQADGRSLPSFALALSVTLGCLTSLTCKAEGQSDHKPLMTND